jgi:hypothetical protein
MHQDASPKVYLLTDRRTACRRGTSAITPRRIDLSKDRFVVNPDRADKVDCVRIIKEGLTTFGVGSTAKAMACALDQRSIAVYGHFVAHGRRIANCNATDERTQGAGNDGGTRAVFAKRVGPALTLGCGSSGNANRHP